MLHGAEQLGTAMTIGRRGVIETTWLAFQSCVHLQVLNELVSSFVRYTYVVTYSFN